MRIYAIGGCNYEIEDSILIDKDILASSHKENPSVLFIPLANNDNENKAKIFKNYYESLGANVDICYVIKNNLGHNELDKLFAEHDIIYFSGGQSKRLLDYGNKIDLKGLILKYLDKKVFAGVSAGAMLFFTYGFSDNEAYIYNLEVRNCKMISCYNIIEGAFCPHYDQSGYFEFNDEIKKYDCNGYAATNGSSIVFSDKINTIKCHGNNGVYFFDKSNKLITPLK